MAEYSKEYCRKENIEFPSDFSYSEIAQSLNEGQTVFQICEGFGTIGITKLETGVFLINRENELIELKA